MKGKGDKTIISIEVSLGKAVLEDLIIGLFVLPFVFVLVVLNTIVNGEFLLLTLPIVFFSLAFLIFGVSLYPSHFQDRNKMLAHIVGYMFRIEETLASQHPIEEAVVYQSPHLAADLESHANEDQAV